MHRNSLIKRTLKFSHGCQSQVRPLRTLRKRFRHPSSPMRLDLFIRHSKAGCYRIDRACKDLRQKETFSRYRPRHGSRSDPLRACVSHLGRVPFCPQVLSLPAAPVLLRGNAPRNGFSLGNKVRGGASPGRDRRKAGNPFRTLSDNRFATICEIPARAVIACKAAYLLILCVLALFPRSLKHAPKRVPLPPP